MPEKFKSDCKHFSKIYFMRLLIFWFILDIYFYFIKEISFKIIYIVETKDKDA